MVVSILLSIIFTLMEKQSFPHEISEILLSKNGDLVKKKNLKM